MWLQCPPETAPNFRPVGQSHRVIAAKIHFVADRKIVDIGSDSFYGARALIAGAQRKGVAVHFADLAADQPELSADTDPGEMGADRDLVGRGIVQYDLGQREVLLLVADEGFGIHGEILSGG